MNRNENAPVNKLLLTTRERSNQPLNKGRKSLVLIGSGRYFGSNILRHFAAKGYNVATISSSRDSAKRLCEEFHQWGLEVFCESADICDSDAFALAVRRLAARLGHVSCLIYNPKVSIKKSGLTTSPQDLELSLAVNVTGSLIAVQEVLPFMHKDDDPSIILTGGAFKDRPDVQRFALSVGKAGLHGVVKTLAGPLQGRGIRLKTIVIDGQVRQDGEIEPDQLAEFFWNVSQSRTGVVFRFGRSLDRFQLPLF